MSVPNPYPHLFAPIRIGPIEVPNRIYMTAHARPYHVPDPTAPGFTLPAANTPAYYAARARGGVGLIIQGGTIVHPTSEYPGLWQFFSEASVDAWRPVVAAAHDHGAKMFVQLMHAGHHGDKKGAFGGPLSSSEVPPVEGLFQGGPYAPLNVPVRSMTLDEIRTVVDAFGQAARNARAAGYDGVELHASHSYLAEQFYSPFYNKRTDSYGGSTENRLRFVVECLEAMRAGAGDSLAVGARLNCDEMLPGGCTPDDMREIVHILDRSGLVDFLDLDVGTYHSMDQMIAPYQAGEHWEMEHIEKVRGAILQSVVLVCPGRFHDPAKGESLVAAGAADLVGGTRGFFADPDLARKAREGRSADIRPCIGLNSCTGGGQCVMNPTEVGELEDVAAIGRRATPRRRILVVGGGPAGLESARLAALQGHEVSLYEGASRLGGALCLMATIPGREHVVAAAEWWGRQLDDLGVQVHLGAQVNAAEVLGRDPDLVIVATGAVFAPDGATAYSPVPIPGWDHPMVVSPEVVLSGELVPDGIVVVLDDEATGVGCGVAEKVAARGVVVEYVTRHAQAAVGLKGFQYPHVMRRFGALGVNVRPDTYVRGVGNDVVEIFDVNTLAEQEIRDVAAVVLVTGRRPRSDLAEALRASDVSVEVIGDARWPRTMVEATTDARQLAQLL